MDMTSELRRHVAVHKAGHATIGRVLNVLCGEASIADGIACGFDIEQSPSGWLGTANIASHKETCLEWFYQSRWRGRRTAYIARAIAFMAGAEAEIAILGDNIPNGDGYDREGVAEVIVGAPGWVEARLRSWTRTLCRRYAEGIKAVADALLREGTLTDAQVRALIGVEKRPYVARLIPVGGWRPCEGVCVG
jgi:hypothetical protein